MRRPFRDYCCAATKVHVRAIVRARAHVRCRTPGSRPSVSSNLPEGEEPEPGGRMDPAFSRVESRRKQRYIDRSLSSRKSSGSFLFLGCSPRLRGDALRGHSARALSPAISLGRFPGPTLSPRAQLDAISRGIHLRRGSWINAVYLTRCN